MKKVKNLPVLGNLQEPSENTRVSQNKMSQIGAHIKLAVHFCLMNIGTNEYLCKIKSMFYRGK